MSNVDAVAVLSMARQHIELCAPDDEITDRLDVARDAVAELIAASPDMMALFRIKWGNTDPDANAVFERFAAALAACKPATGDDA